jgi:hypothetical protein
MQPNDAPLFLPFAAPVPAGSDVVLFAVRADPPVWSDDHGKPLWVLIDRTQNTAYSDKRYFDIIRSRIGRVSVGSPVSRLEEFLAPEYKLRTVMSFRVAETVVTTGETFDEPARTILYRLPAAPMPYR